MPARAPVRARHLRFASSRSRGARSCTRARFTNLTGELVHRSNFDIGQIILRLIYRARNCALYYTHSHGSRNVEFLTRPDEFPRFFGLYVRYSAMTTCSRRINDSVGISTMLFDGGKCFYDNAAWSPSLDSENGRWKLATSFCAVVKWLADSILNGSPIFDAADGIWGSDVSRSSLKLRKRRTEFV